MSKTLQTTARKPRATSTPRPTVRKSMLGMMLALAATSASTGPSGERGINV